MPRDCRVQADRVWAPRGRTASSPRAGVKRTMPSQAPRALPRVDPVDLDALCRARRVRLDHPRRDAEPEVRVGPRVPAAHHAHQVAVLEPDPSADLVVEADAPMFGI